MITDTIPHTNIVLKSIYENQHTYDVKNNFNNNNVVENRIIFKSNYQSDIQGIKESYWKNLHYYSASFLPLEIPEEKLKNSIVLIGGTYNHNDDKFTTSALPNTRTQYGIEVHANSLLSLFYLEGQLKKAPLLLSIIIVFLGILIIESICAFFCDFESFKLKMITMTLVTLGVFFVISIILLNSSNHYWFNWLIPTIVAQVGKYKFFIKSDIIEKTFKIKRKYND